MKVMLEVKNPIIIKKEYQNQTYYEMSLVEVITTKYGQKTQMVKITINDPLMIPKLEKGGQFPAEIVVLNNGSLRLNM